MKLMCLHSIIDSKQKRVNSLTKLLAIPGMESEQKDKILEKIMLLMDEIQEDEKALREVSLSKRVKSDIVEKFLTTGENRADNQIPAVRGGEVTQVTPRNLDLE